MQQPDSNSGDFLKNINLIFLEYGDLNETEFDQAIKTVEEVLLNSNSSLYLIIKALGEEVNGNQIEKRKLIREECNKLLEQFHLKIERIQELETKLV